VIHHKNAKFENESAKKAIIASKIGEMPLSKEKVPKKRNESMTTIIHPRNHTTIESIETNQSPIKSILGGESTSSGERLPSSGTFKKDIVNNDKEGSN